MKNYKILVINPGSTSDELALFLNDKEIFHKVVRYSPEQLAPFEKKKVTAQFGFRKKFILQTLNEYNVNISTLHAVIGRGGLVKFIPSGTYSITPELKADLEKGILGDHPSNLGGLLADSIAREVNIPAFIADPVVVDEMWTLARYSGMPENPRISIFHALNQKRVGRIAAEMLGKKYEDCNFIIFHGGGGVTCGAHLKGKVVDVNNGLDGEGPFTPQRSGGVPAGGLMRLCFSGNYTKDEIKLMIKGRGGLIAYTGTSDVQLLKKFINSEPLSEEEKKQIKEGLTKEKAREAIEAMAYQISKEICALAAIFKGKIDAIILTGGLAYDNDIIIPFIKEHVGFLGKIIVIPGGDEMRALKDAALRVLKEEEKAKNYIDYI